MGPVVNTQAGPAPTLLDPAPARADQAPARADQAPAPADQMPRPGRTHQFLTMDALRGVAALAVIAFHGRAVLKPIQFPSGYLAVDFFFLLSGFVLTYAYGNRLDDGWSTWSYLKTRLVRLYPLYVLGLLLGLLRLAGLNLLRHMPPVDGAMAGSLLLGLLILPVLSTHPFSGTTAFPLNYPSWSIFFELLINGAQALFLRRRGAGFLIGVAAVSFAAMLGYTYWTGTINLGLNSPENLLCVFRVLFSYTLGMLLFRVWRSGRVRLRIPPTLIAVLLLLALALRLGHWRVLQELLVTAGLFPVLIFAAASVEPGPRWQPLFRLLGQVSYAIYILHGPLLSVGEQLWSMLRHGSVERDAPWSGLLFLALLIVICLAVDRWYDLPARAWLRRRLLPR